MGPVNQDGGSPCSLLGLRILVAVGIWKPATAGGTGRVPQNRLCAAEFPVSACRAVGCPDARSNMILGAAVRVFLDEISP